MVRKATEKKEENTNPVGTTGVEVTESVTVEDPVAVKLKNLGVDIETIEKIKSELGVASIEDLEILTEDDLKEVGIKKVPAKKIIKAINAEKSNYTASETVATNVAANAAFSSFETILPSVPSDESWMTALQAGGVQKVSRDTIIAAIKAALAAQVHFFDVPGIIAKAMETFSEESEEPVPPEFFELRNQVTRRSYAEIFQAIKGLDGSFVTDSRKRQLFGRINSELWPAILGFNNQLKSWYEAWAQGAANPMAMMGMLMATNTGRGGIMPPGMMQPPDTGVLRDNADAVVNAINKVFAGVGVQIASALAYDATKIKETLTDPRLPAMVGAANRDMMLKKLDIAVPATYPRMEQNLVRYVLAILALKDQQSGDEEYRYLGMLYMLGSQIAWDQLMKESSTLSKGPTGIGSSGNLRGM